MLFDKMQSVLLSPCKGPRVKNFDVYVLLSLRSMSSSVVVKTKSGPVRGFAKKSLGKKDFWSFRGIPYAEAARFKLPQPATWNHVLDASKCGPDCPQFNLFTRQLPQTLSYGLLEHFLSKCPSYFIQASGGKRGQLPYPERLYARSSRRPRWSF